MSDERSRRFDRAASESSRVAGVIGGLAALCLLGALVPWASTDPGTSPSGWTALFELAGLAGMAFSAAFAAVSYFTGVLAEVERLP
jgi:hypothetical protein